MSKYSEKNLRNGEVIIKKAKVNPLCAIKEIVIFIVLLVIGIVANIYVPIAGIWILLAMIFIGVIALIAKIIYLCSLDLAVTNKRIIGKVGVIQKESLDYPINKVDNVTIQNSFWGAIFRFSTVCVLGGGGTDVKIYFKGISNAIEFKNSVTDGIEQYADEARKAQAAEIAAAMSNRPQY